MRCKLCGNNAAQARMSATDGDVTDWQQRLPIARIRSIVGAPYVCRTCACAIAHDYAQEARALAASEKGKKP